MRKLSFLFVLLVMLVAVGCQSATNDTVEEKMNSNTVNETDANEELSPNDGKPTKSLSEIEADELYRWSVSDHETIILVAEEGEIIVRDLDSAQGRAGEREFTGEVGLYLVNADDDVGYLHDSVESITLNLDRAFHDVVYLVEVPFIAWFQPEYSNSYSARMWYFYDGELKRATLDEVENFYVTSTTLKFIHDRFLQTYVYDNHGDGVYGIGWHYTTWEWDEATGNFSEYDVTRYTDDQPYQWEVGELQTKFWLENEAFYVDFPEIELTEHHIDLMKRGMMIDERFQIGDSIHEVLNELPEPYEHDYCEGGIYYAFPGPFVYFYDEVTEEVTNILVSGQSLMHDVDSIKQLLGAPEREEYVEYIEANILVYDFGQYSLQVEYVDDDINNLWYRTKRE